ncbi:hypothetical protein [Poseidonocella sp. HB161398]|uniref:hypothetical protein n=1 Tax=Poseidonocella sp. HB161398 TaxID=2320855 RepID=UPI001108D91A|nr:hypothetical protein [Poseidonocella sp. HB161398]
MNVFPFSAIFRAPLSGDVAQSIAPEFDGIAGVPEIEQRVVREVASYGTQLGMLLDAVEALAEHVPALAADPRVARALELKGQIAEVKAEEAGSLQARAERLLASLHRVSPAGHAALMEAERTR